MRRTTIALMCLLALSLGSCRRVSPPSSGTPSDVRPPVDLAQALITLAPEAQAELDRPLSVTEAAEILKGALSSIPAAEILGQRVIDDLIATIDEMQEASLTSTPGGSGRLASLASPAWNGDDGSGFQAKKAFDQDGFGGEVSMNGSIEQKGDRVMSNVQLSVQIQGTAADRLGQVLEVSITIQGDQNACPTAEGESKGTFSGDSNMSVIASNASYGRTVTGKLDMEAHNAEDGTLDSAEFAFEGSLNFNISGQAWGVSFTSQASSVNPKDYNSIMSQLAGNRQGDFSPPPADSKITVDSFAKAVLDAIDVPLTLLSPGTAFAERLWLTANKCVEITVAPDEIRLAPGESETVEAEVTLNADGGSVAADIVAQVLGRGGEISPEKANSSSGATADFTYTAPDEGPAGSFSLEATSKAGKAYKALLVKSPRIEWSGTFTTAGSSTIQDVGSSQGTTTFTIRFQADLSLSAADVGDLIPFELESDASMSWTGTATALGIVQPFSGSTSSIVTPNYSNPDWFIALPEGNYLAGEGYVDLSEQKLHLFLLGIGDETGYGTFNLSPNSTCNYHHDLATNRVYLVFPLDEEFNIADGSCSDTVSSGSGGQGGMKIQSSRSWHFETHYVSESESGP